MDHPFVIKYVERLITNDGKIHIVTKFCKQGTLRNLLESPFMRPRTEDEILSCFTMICLGISHIHSKGVIHRDIRLDNIFIDDKGILKIGEFSISNIL